MAASNFLQLTNRVLNAFNEVELTSTLFPNTIGFYTEAKNAVNQGLFDAYSYENVKWPFLFVTQNFPTTVGGINYTLAAAGYDIDWNSFRLTRQQYTITITQTGGLATATTSIPHAIKTGDAFFISGADQAGYNQDAVYVTVTGASTFTYNVVNTTVSPATGTITAKSNTVQYHRLYPIDINEYRLSYADANENQVANDFRRPVGVVRTQDNNLILFMNPDRIYGMSYDSFVVPAGLSTFSDVHLIPEKYEQAIVDFALHYCYMFRDNVDEATAATKRAEDRIRRMRKDIIPVQSNVNWG